jgi:hypothetical protein
MLCRAIIFKLMASIACVCDSLWHVLEPTQQNALKKVCGLFLLLSFASSTDVLCYVLLVFCAICSW